MASPRPRRLVCDLIDDDLATGKLYPSPKRDVLLWCHAHHRSRRVSRTSRQYHRRGLRIRLRNVAGEETRFEAVADRLHAGELDTDDGRRMDRDPLVIQLYHYHLPKLADHGVVDSGRERGTIEYYSNEQLEAELDSISAEVSPANPYV